MAHLPRMAVLAVTLVLALWSTSVAASKPGLPEDTFRRLAAVLYSRSDKEENRLTRKFLYNRNLTCNDGTPAGYYIRRNPASRRWVLFLEGGWYCYDRMSCEARWLRLRTLMSSSQWTEERTVGGIMSSDQAENPHFAEANHVLLPYCSSDSWSGTAHSSLGQKFAFLGAEIVQEVVRELFSWEQLAAGTELYLAGSSAGGTGVLVNLDPVAELVRSLGSRMRVRGIMDSGWFLDNDPFSSLNKMASSPSATVAAGAELWRARVPDSCAQAFPGEEWKCFFGYRIYPTMKSPLFVFQWQFDEAQMRADNVGSPATPAQWNFIHRQGRNLRSSLEAVATVFAPSCISHTILTKRAWTRMEVGGVSLPDALQCWVEQEQPGEAALGSLAPPPAPGHLRAVQADSPHTNLKRLNSNLVKSIGSHQTNSMGHRTKKMRHKPNIVHNRTNKRNKNKRRRSKKRCRYGDSLESKIRCAKEENEARKHREKALVKSEEVERSNRDLVRSIQRGSGLRQQRQRRRRRRKRQRRLSSDQRLSKEERRALRREEKRRLKKELKRRKKKEESGRQGRRMRDHSSFLPSPSSFPRGRRRVGTRSIQAAGSAPPQCKARYVDTCSWPQCNRSCPKLHNPLTGEEMDFLELLKSFGLNLSSVAAALGIDIATLNNMDQDVLLHLLTSQTKS